MRKRKAMCNDRESSSSRLADGEVRLREREATRLMGLDAMDLQLGLQDRL